MPDVTLAEIREMAQGILLSHEEIGGWCDSCRAWRALLSRLPAEGVIVTEESLAKALVGLWRLVWVESAARGWHYQTWMDESVAGPFDDGDLAAAILLRALRGEK